MPGIGGLSHFARTASASATAARATLLMVMLHLRGQQLTAIRVWHKWNNLNAIDHRCQTPYMGHIRRNEMADRSPNFPSMPLGEAIEAIKKIHAAEGRSKMPRLSVVKPLGYTSINGRSLSVLGALKAYGLIDGRADELRISQEGFTLANAPVNSDEYREALAASFRAPSAFQRFTEEDEGASADTLKWKLQKVGFQPDSAERLVRVYRESRELVNAAGGAYKPREPEEEATANGFNPSVENMMNDLMPFPGTGNKKPDPAQGQTPPPDQGGLAMSVHERVLQSGMLSKAASYRVIVSGPVGVAEIERLVKKIEMDKEILADPDPDPETNADDPA